LKIILFFKNFLNRFRKRQRIEVFLTQKTVTKLSEIWAGSGIRKKLVSDPGFGVLKSTGSRIRDTASQGVIFSGYW
jgi:hypothetical protein